MAKNNKNENNWYSELEILNVDLFILNILKNELENKVLDFIDIKTKISLEDISHLNCDIWFIEKRIFHNIWLKYIEIAPIPQDLDTIIQKCEEKEIDPQLIIYTKKRKHLIKNDVYLQYFLEIKINAEWLKRICELKKDIKYLIRKNSLFYRYLDKSKLALIWLKEYKIAIWLFLTLWFFGLSYFMNLPVRSWINHIPFLASIVDVDFLKNFEDIDKNDIYYKILEDKIKKEWITIKVYILSETEQVFQIQNYAWINYYDISNTNWYFEIQEITDENTKEQLSKAIDYWLIIFQNPTDNNRFYNKLLEHLNINTPMSFTQKDIKDIKVKDNKDNEKMFKIELNNGSTIYFQIQEVNWQYKLINMKNPESSEQESTISENF